MIFVWRRPKPFEIIWDFAFHVVLILELMQMEFIVRIGLEFDTISFRTKISRRSLDSYVSI